jgi:tetratricopeptide (TPR) repeat protein
LFSEGNISSTTSDTDDDDYDDSDDSIDEKNILVWLDSNNDVTENSYRRTIANLQQTIKMIHTFTDPDKCVELLAQSRNNHAFMIISGAFGQNLVPIIHELPQITSIFVFCGNKPFHDEWAKKWSKIKGVFTEIVDLCTAFKHDVADFNRKPKSNSFTSTKGDTPKQNLDRLDPTLMYTQILKEIILQIHFDDDHIKDFITYCREQFVGNNQELKNCDKVEQEYRQHTPIWWYTYSCFLHPMLNRALRTMDVSLIIKMGFFIQDLLRQIDQLHSQQFHDDQHSKAFTVYRGQCMSKTDFNHLNQVKGGLLSFNNFLSTSKNRATSQAFAESGQDNPDLIGILFIMTIDPSSTSTSFAAIRDVSCYHDSDDEVLFSMHTIFRVGDIKQMGSTDRVWQVKLTSTDDDDKKLRTLTEHIQNEIEGPTAWHRLGNVLLKLGQFDKAEEVYNILLSQKNDHLNLSTLYNQLGSVKNSKGEYEEAIKLYEKSLEIRQKTLSPKHRLLAQSYNNLGSAHLEMKEYAKALSFLGKAVEIRQQSLPPDHPDLADSYDNTGSVYEKMGDHSQALAFHEKALGIREKTLPPNQIYLAQSYNNMGLVYLGMKDYAKAFSFFEKALEIRQQTLPPNHPDIANSCSNLGSVYENLGNHSEALSCHERAVEIGQRSLHTNHPTLQQWQKKLEDMKKTRV